MSIDALETNLIYPKNGLDNGEHLTLPIKCNSNPEPVVDLVDQILSAKQRDPKADTTAWEREIDHLVYKLYGLTPEEITLVEESRQK